MNHTATSGTAQTTGPGSRHYRVERRFCGDRHYRELVRDLLKAHGG